MRYVILRHITSHDHYDFMFEKESFLITFSMESYLIDDFFQGKEVAIHQIADHRLLYLDYEGPINGNRGSVVRVDSGHYFELHHKKATVEYSIEGTKLAGTLEINNIDEIQLRMRYKPSVT